QRPDVERIGNGEGAADMRRQQLEDADLALSIARRRYGPASVHGGDPAAGLERVEADVVEHPMGFQHVMIEAALEQLVVGTNGGKGMHVADLVDDAGGRKRAVLIVLLDELRKFRGVADLEQMDVLDVPQVVNAHAARRALAQLDDPPDGIAPALRIERAVVDRADRIGQRLRGNSVQTVHAAPSPAGRSGALQMAYSNATCSL